MWSNNNPTTKCTEGIIIIIFIKKQEHEFKTLMTGPAAGCLDPEHWFCSWLGKDHQFHKRSRSYSYLFCMMFKFNFMFMKSCNRKNIFVQYLRKQVYKGLSAKIYVQELRWRLYISKITKELLNERILQQQ